MAPGIIPFNLANPLCTANQCLQQVIGSLGNDPVEQYSSCVSMFGSPTTVTMTLLGDVVLSTTTATVLYTDIIVTPSTTLYTDYATETSYAEVVETATGYSATSVATVTEVVTAPTSPVQSSAPVKRRSHKKRGCQPRSSSVLSSTTSSATPSAAPNCADLAEYSSACSCINAASSAITVTTSIPGATEVVTVTESSTVASTSPSAVTVVVSSTVVVPATTTVTTTVTGLFKTTITVTSTTTPVPPTQTAYLVATGGLAKDKYLKVANGYLQYDYGNAGVSVAERFNILTAGGPLSLASNPEFKLYDWLIMMQKQAYPDLIEAPYL
ncbi:hypothetical protein N0V88_005945 [Collariella sp. IMI 366227]|nr:hypothetical protein N0V88_005945 [Collariella sp. IMI 366227]